jgi:hypothetical protein
MKRILFTLLFLAFTTAVLAEDDLSKTSVEALIDGLAKIDAPTAGLHGTASVRGFIAEDKPLTFGGGVLGSPAPKIPSEMRELVRRGPVALPQLIEHLGDKRPTKLTIGEDFFTFRLYSDEYDPKVRQKVDEAKPREKVERDFRGGYTVKIGDVCYALVGQIVNRRLLPIRYQPTAGLVVNSPIEEPELAERVKKDWGKLDAATHKASLMADAQVKDDSGWSARPALVRLRFYYPGGYKRLKEGELKDRISALEREEKEER